MKNLSFLLFSFRCNECNRRYPSQRDLDSHMKTHKKRSMQCTICKKMFVSHVSLKTHMQRHEENNETEDGLYIKFMAENFDLKCDHCDTVLPAFHDARRHYKEFHGDPKGYLKCCNVKLREIWMIREHIQLHLNPESFKYVDKLEHSPHWELIANSMFFF